jgi:hypothetical protein
MVGIGTGIKHMFMYLYIAWELYQDWFTWYLWKVFLLYVVCLFSWMELESGYLLKSCGESMWGLCYDFTLIFWFTLCLFQGTVYYMHWYCVYCWDLSQEIVINLCGTVIWGVYLYILYTFLHYFVWFIVCWLFIFLYWWKPRQVNVWRAEKGTHTICFPKG